MHMDWWLIAFLGLMAGLAVSAIMLIFLIDVFEHD